MLGSRHPCRALPQRAKRNMAAVSSLLLQVWLGDFNYRIDGAYEAVREAAIRNELGALLELVIWGGGGE